MNYYLFTNLKKEECPNTSWDIITINLNEFEQNLDVIKISRYYKFMIHKQLNKMNKDYDIIFYCDSHLSPINYIDWFDKAYNAIFTPK